VHPVHKEYAGAKIVQVRKFLKVLEKMEKAGKKIDNADK
jgi:hypothetical protein